jgi:hypothetical protein
MACTELLTGEADGTCANVTAGTAPSPASQCTATAQPTCGTNGMCDGNGGCQFWSTSTLCGSASCTPEPTCNGSGTCNAPAAGSCAGGTTCSGSSECATGECALGECSYIAYADAVENGNQNYTGSLGMDFEVAANTSITVTAMGAFDDLAHTGSGTIIAGIFSTSTQALVSGTQVTITSTTGTLIGGDYFTSLSSPVTLPGGASGTTYTVVAVGYGPSYENGNSGVGGGWELNTESTGGGKISFTGTARFGNSGTGFVWPTNIDGGPANRYGAGTFLFY